MGARAGAADFREGRLPRRPTEGYRSVAVAVRRTRRDHHPMRRPLVDAPWWALALLTGLPFGVAMALFGARDGSSWLHSAVGGAIAGVCFGVAMGVVLRRQNARHREVVRALPPEVARVAHRATWRGPVPADPEARAATVRLIEHQLTELQRRRALFLIEFGVFEALYVVNAIVGSPWWWAAAVFFAAMLLMTLLLPPRMRRRADLIRASAPR